MGKLPNRRILIRWMFNAVGFALILRHQFMVEHVLNLEFWANLIFGPQITAGYALFMAGGYFYLLGVSFLCWIAAFGLKHRYGWARPVGLATSTLLLFGFPWLTVLGALAIYVLRDDIPTASHGLRSASALSNDYWSSKRRSKAQPVVLLLVSIAGYWFVMEWLTQYAQRAGLPPARGWIWFFAFVLVHTTLHESGHAIMAWAVGFKIQVVCIGPITIRRADSRFRFGFDLARLFEQGGYMGAIPVRDTNLRFDEIAVVAAGPAVNALTSVVMLAILFSLPGTKWQDWWWIAAYNAVLAAVLATGNLIPVGYCDGTMLFHLLLWTTPGRLLVDRKRWHLMRDRADLRQGRAEFDKVLELSQTMLERSLVYGRENAATTAASHGRLASAFACVDDLPMAELQYRKCLDFPAEMSANPDLAGHVWSGLYRTAVYRHDAASVGANYSTLVKFLESRKPRSGPLAGHYATFARLAMAHQLNGAFESALTEIELGAQSISAGPDAALQRAYLLSRKSSCVLGLGDIEGGIAAIQSAAGILRSAEISPAHRNLAALYLANGGCDLWRNTRNTLAIDLVREGIAKLESGGAAFAAFPYRIALAGFLRQLGEFDGAWEALPQEPSASHLLRHTFLAERAELRLAVGDVELAVADCRELVALWRAHPCTPAPEIASAEALLAEACLAAGDMAEADALAVRAADVLGPWQHPYTASCLVTLALARSESAGGFASAGIGEAIRLLDAAPLLTAAEKARLKAAQLGRIPQATAPAFS